MKLNIKVTLSFFPSFFSLFLHIRTAVSFCLCGWTGVWVPAGGVAVLCAADVSQQFVLCIAFSLCEFLFVVFVLVCVLFAVSRRLIEMRWWIVHTDGFMAFAAEVLSTHTADMVVSLHLHNRTFACRAVADPSFVNGHLYIAYQRFFVLFVY